MTSVTQHEDMDRTGAHSVSSGRCVSRASSRSVRTFHPVHYLARAPFAHRLHHERHGENFAPTPLAPLCAPRAPSSRHPAPPPTDRPTDTCHRFQPLAHPPRKAGWVIKIKNPICFSSLNDDVLLLLLPLPLLLSSKAPEAPPRLPPQREANCARAADWRVR